jgi:hypothetical protein
MSARPYYAYPAPVRLLWYRTYGVARCDGVEVELRVPPVVLDLKNMTELDFVPGSVATVRLGDDAKRDLHGYEIAAIERRLKRMAIAARDALARGEVP